MDRGEGVDVMAVAGDGLEKFEDMIVRQAEATGAQVAAAKAAIGNVIFGQDPVVEQALITVLCGGHALLIGLPGLAKTKLVETMGIVLGPHPECQASPSRGTDASIPSKPCARAQSRVLTPIMVRGKSKAIRLRRTALGGA